LQGSGLSKKRKSLQKERTFLEEKEEKEETEDKNWREWFDFAEKSKEMQNSIKHDVDAATIKLPDRPAKIIFSSDWHMGAVSVNYQSLRKNLDYILETPDTYVILVGDIIDNFVKFSSMAPILDQVINPKAQKKVMKIIATELKEKGKLLAACWGNHDISRDERLFGESPVGDILATACPYFNGKGEINLSVGKQNYSIVISHDLKGHSMHNKNHAQTRQLKQYSPNADIVVSAHKHDPSIQTCYMFGQKKAMVACGTFQESDTFSKRYWQPGQIGAPVVIFDNEQKNFEALMGLEMMEKIR